MNDTGHTVPVSVCTETIALGQFLKLAGACATGGECKAAVARGEVAVNGETCRQRGRTLHVGDRVRLGGCEWEVARS